jgi:hypothetical protein
LNYKEVTMGRCSHCHEEKVHSYYFADYKCHECGRVFFGKCWEICKVLYKHADACCKYCQTGPTQMFDTDTVFKFMLEKFHASRAEIEALMRTPAKVEEEDDDQEDDHTPHDPVPPTKKRK